MPRRAATPGAWTQEASPMPIADYENNPSRRAMVDAKRWPGFQWERQAPTALHPYLWNYVTKEKVVVNGKTVKKQRSERLDGVTEEEALKSWEVKRGKKAAGEMVIAPGEITLRHVADLALANLDEDV